MIRTVIKIDEELCNGCGICEKACHEGAIGIVNGKAKLLRDDFCDGIGDCLPNCPVGAITFEKREAVPYNEAAVMENKRRIEQAAQVHRNEMGCPGSRMRDMRSQENCCENEPSVHMPSMLQNWPVQIKLAPIQAPYFHEAKLLIAADCTAFSYASFHQTFMKDRVTLIGCPKLDAIDYSEKLSEIVRVNNILEITVVRMEVPCCGGIEMAVKNAVRASGKDIKVRTVIVSISGDVLN